jgi:putative cardiolipin synthase
MQEMFLPPTQRGIVSPYFVPGEKCTRFLTDKPKQGIRVRILTNSLESNDVAMVLAGYIRYRENLIAGGVELYEFKAVRSSELEEKMDTNKIDAERASLSWRGTGGISAGQR